MTTNVFESLTAKSHHAKLTTDELACALFEGMPHLQNLAENLARQHSKAGALAFYDMMGDDVQNFWRGIAKQLIEHASQWRENEGSACVLGEYERVRLSYLPRIPREP